MKLSIITCTYNSDKFLQENIDSVIDQKLDKNIYEHIFVDAYSTDNTKKIIEKYMQKFSNVKLIEKEPKGVYNAMNAGIKEAKGEYILCLNSDDRLANGILKKYLKYIEGTGNLDIYYGKVSYTYDKKHFYTNQNNFLSLRKFLYKNFGFNGLVNHPSILMKKSLFEGDIGYFDETKKVSSDYGLLLKCLSLKKDFCYFPEIVTYFRIHDGSISTNGKNDKIARNENVYFKKKYLPSRKAYISMAFDKIAAFIGKFIAFLMRRGKNR